MPSHEAEHLLAEAKEKAAVYKWTDATELYHKALSNANPSEIAKVTELLAKSYFKSAFQAKNRQDFSLLMERAREAYDKGSKAFRDTSSTADSKRLEAKSLYCEFWLTNDPSQKRILLSQSTALADEATRLFEGQNEKRELTSTLQDLVGYLIETSLFATDHQTLRQAINRGVALAEAMVHELEEKGDRESMVEALARALGSYSDIGSISPADYKALGKKPEQLRKRMQQAAEAPLTAYEWCLLKEAEGFAAGTEGDWRSAVDSFQSGLERVEETEDSFLAARLFTGLVVASVYSAFPEDNVEQRRFLLENALQVAPKATERLEVSNHPSYMEAFCSLSAEACIALAIDVETNPEKKKAWAQKAIEFGRKGMNYDNRGFSEASHPLSKALYFLATMEEEPGKKRSLLKESLALRQESTPHYEAVFPESWAPGGVRNYTALIKSELANLETDQAAKTHLLRSAVTDMEKAMEICTRLATNPDMLSLLGRYGEWYGDILLRLFTTSGETEAARRAIKVYQDATEPMNKSGRTGSIPPVEWKIAKACDSVGDYSASSKAFANAAQAYRLEANKIPGLSSTFQELAAYMDSWALIEGARQHHKNEQFLSAAEAYSKAATELEKTKTWNQLAKHYMACSLLEAGEVLARQERADQAKESFQSAETAFRETANGIAKLLSTSLAHETPQLEEWLKITNDRGKYAHARQELEEAKLLDKKGDEEESSSKYTSASELFKDLANGATDPGRREVETLAIFCDALSKMKRAEVEASPQLYSEAADSFTKAKDTATNRRTRLQALANASICKALELGTKFRVTRDTNLYSEIKKNLEAASVHYEDAGLKSQSDWTRATQRLFDALAYLSDAEAEREPRKKTELYHLAEKHLQFAARLYGEAGFPTKQQEANRHLQRAKEEKELLLTPIEALAESPTLSNGPISSPVLARDQAIGLERFEAANVVGNLNIPQREISVGSELTVELEIANVGKTAATLMKLENIILPGFEVATQNTSLKLQQGFIDMKGKRLDYLKTHEVKLPLKALNKGIFQLKPRILFVDEKGAYRSYEFEPASITVRELGIAGWLKGPAK